MNNIGGSEDHDRKVEELTEQIKIYKAELADKQKEFQEVWNNVFQPNTLLKLYISCSILVLWLPF